MKIRIIVIITVIIALFLLFVRYDKEQVGYYDIKYDRLTGNVYVKSITSDKWIKTEIPDMKIARAYFQKKQIENAINR